MKQIDLFLLGDTADSPQKFSIKTETTIGYKLKRQDINKELSESFYNHLKTPGVYILFGKTPHDNHDIVYVGQSDNVAKRLYEHKGGLNGEKEQGKIFWNDCIAFVTSNDVLQKGHAEYLEVEFYKKIYAAERYLLENTNMPSDKKMSEEGLFICNDFIADCDLLSQLMGKPIFVPMESKHEAPSNKFVLDNSSRIGDSEAKYVNATGHMRPTEEYKNGFTVLENSIIAKNVTKKASKSIRDMRKDLKKRGYLKEENDKLVFKKEYTFPSPGIAASVVLGRSASAKEWKEV